MKRDGAVRARRWGVRTRAWFFGFAAACAVACTSSGDKTRGSEDSSHAVTRTNEVARPWTDRFRKPSLLVADTVRVEGPVGLLEHLATRTEPDAHSRREETTTQGFLQEIVQKPDVPLAEIHAFLDQLEIVAMKRITVLERPGPVDVVVVATGDVYFRDIAAKTERRETSLRIEGKVERRAER